MKNKGTNKGITLIALVITIIIMLILVAVTITMAINGGLFGNAGKAVGDTQNAINAEQGLAGGAITIGGTTYNSIDEYVNGKEWTTIFEGEATAVNSMAFLTENMLFKNDCNYRITGEVNGQEEIIETVALFGGIEDGIELYLLCVIDGDEIITWISYSDLMEQVPNISENAILIYGCNIPNTGSGIIITDPNINITVTKIEECEHEIDGTKLFEGEIVLKSGEGIEVQGFTIDPTKEYTLVISYDGIRSTTTTATVAWFDGGAMCCIVLETNNWLILASNGIGYLTDEEEEHEVIIYKIYETGVAENYVEENGFGLYYSDNAERWELIKTPNTSYVVPDTIAGYPVEMVNLDIMEGTPTFNKPFNLDCWDTGKAEISVKVTCEDYEFIFGFYTENCFKDIDLSECGNDVQIPEEYLESTTLTIYVNSAVKQNYLDYDNIVAK